MKNDSLVRQEMLAKHLFEESLLASQEVGSGVPSFQWSEVRKSTWRAWMRFAWRLQRSTALREMLWEGWQAGAATRIESGEQTNAGQPVLQDKTAASPDRANVLGSPFDSGANQ